MSVIVSECTLAALTYTARCIPSRADTEWVRQWHARVLCKEVAYTGKRHEFGAMHGKTDRLLPADSCSSSSSLCALLVCCYDVIVHKRDRDEAVQQSVPWYRVVLLCLSGA